MMPIMPAEQNPRVPLGSSYRAIVSHGTAWEGWLLSFPQRQEWDSFGAPADAVRSGGTLNRLSEAEPEAGD